MQLDDAEPSYKPCNTLDESLREVGVYGGQRLAGWAVVLTLELQHHITQVCLDVVFTVGRQYQAQTTSGSIPNRKQRKLIKV